MKLHLKLTSVLLSAVMCASMVMAPVSVIADETSAHEETQTTEVSEKNETKETEKKTPKPSDKTVSKESKATEKAEPDETKEEESEDKKTAEKEGKETSSSEKTAPSDTNEKIPSEPVETEPSSTTKIKEEETAISKPDEQPDIVVTRPRRNDVIPSPIKSVTVFLDAPKIGYSPDYEATLPSGANYYSKAFTSGAYKNNIIWRDLTTSGNLNPNSSVFKQDHKYQVNIYLSPKEGYYFSSSDLGKVTLNGVEVVADTSSAGDLHIQYTFITLGTDISSVSITLDAPVAGEQPDYTATFPSGAHYKISPYNKDGYKNGIQWYDMTAHINVDPTNGVFKAGHKYEVNLLIDPEEGYKLTNPTTKLNGQSVLTSEVNLNQLRVMYRFEPLSGEITDLIKSVSVTLDAPVIGKTPDYTAVFPNGAHYYSAINNVDDYRNDIIWKDLDTGNYVNPTSGVFQAGHQYQVIIYVSAYEPKYFSDSTTVTLNNKTAIIINYGSKLYITYTFPPLASVNTLSVKPKTAKVKYKKLRKKKQTVSRSKVMTVSNPQGNVTYKLIGVKRGKSKKYKKYFKINATTGTVSIKKKLRKGTYKITCKVTAGGNESYKSATKTVTFKIKVK